MNAPAAATPRAKGTALVDLVRIARQEREAYACRFQVTWSRTA